MVKILDVEKNKTQDDLPKRADIAVNKLNNETLETIEKIYGEKAKKLSFQDEGEGEINEEIKKKFRIKTQNINGWTIRTFYPKKNPEYLGIAIFFIAFIVIAFLLYTKKTTIAKLLPEFIEAFVFILIFAFIGFYLEYRKQKKMRQNLENDENLKDNPDL